MSSLSKLTIYYLQYTNSATKPLILLYKVFLGPWQLLNCAWTF